jgi:hypothetical protein
MMVHNNVINSCNSVLSVRFYECTVIVPEFALVAPSDEFVLKNKITFGNAIVNFRGAVLTRFRTHLFVETVVNHLI